MSQVRSANLTSNDLVAALDVVHLFNDAEASDLVSVDGLALLARVVGCETASVVQTDHVSRRITRVLGITRADRNLVPAPGFAEAVAAHPGFVAYRERRLVSGRSASLVGLADRSELGRMALYVDFYRPAGTVDQMISIVDLNGRHGMSLLINRSRVGFSTRDRALVELLTPHIGRAISARARMQALAAAVRHGSRSSASAQRAVECWADLTPREQQIALRVSEGGTDREIAGSLGISPRTVHKHLEQVYRKLEIGNRASLTALLAGGDGQYAQLRMESTFAT